MYIYQQWNHIKRNQESLLLKMAQKQMFKKIYNQRREKALQWKFLDTVKETLMHFIECIVDVKS